MVFLADLWLAIVIGTFVLWIMSFIAWVLLPHHYGDNQRLQNEDGMMQFLQQEKVAPGNYFFPYCGSAKEQNDKAYVEKYTQGPRGTLNVYAMPNMASNMIRTILYFLVTALTIGYVTHIACPPGDPATDFMRVFRIAGSIGVLVYATSGVLDRIWFTRRMWTSILDGVAYGLAIGLIFASMWPASV